MIGTPQWLQRGASMWIAHANESNVCVVPPMRTSNALSYALPQTSQFFIHINGASDTPGVPGATLAPSSLMTLASTRLRMAVIGQGHFAQTSVLPAIAQLHDVELAAIVSGSQHKLDELGERYQVRHRATYDELGDLLGSGAIDVAYIAVPNDLHAQLTVTCARHGVHVICEKPMAPTEAECMQMIRACEQRRLKLMVAYRLHFEAANLVAVESTRGGEIGE